MELELFETSRLVLRKITPQDLIFIFENLETDEIMELLGHDSDEAYLKEKRKYEKGYTSYNRTQVSFQLIDRESNEIIGMCGYHNWYMDHKRAELGYAITNEAFKGKGIMSEACEFIIGYGFQVMNLHRIEALVGTENIPSLKLMEKFDFMREGLLREHYFVNDKFEDSIIFSRINPMS